MLTSVRFRRQVNQLLGPARGAVSLQGFDGQSIAADLAQWVPPFACKLKEMLVTATAARV